MNRKAHVRRCGGCRNLETFLWLPYPGILRTDIPGVIEGHARKPLPDYLPACRMPFCVAHDRIGRVLADRIARLAGPHERWCMGKGKMRRRIPFRVLSADQPKGYEPQPCRCRRREEDPRDPCDKAGDVELQYRANGVQAHVSIWPALGARVTAAGALAGWERSLQPYREWCLARWEDLKWLAREDLRLDPSGRKFSKLGKGR